MEAIDKLLAIEEIRNLNQLIIYSLYLSLFSIKYFGKVLSNSTFS